MRGPLISLAWEHNIRLSYEIFRLLWNPKFHCHVCSNPQLDSILSEINPSYSNFEYPVVILPKSPNGLCPSAVPHKILHVFLMSICHIFRSPHPPRSDRSNYRSAWRTMQIMTVIMRLPASSCYFVPLTFTYCLQQPVPYHCALCVLPLSWGTVSLPYYTVAIIVVLRGPAGSLALTVLGRICVKWFWTEW
jgi:hypothetical protein